MRYQWRLTTHMHRDIRARRKLLADELDNRVLPINQIDPEFLRRNPDVKEGTITPFTRMRVVGPLVAD